MKTKQILGLAAFFIGIAPFFASADPIQNNTYYGYKAGWFPSYQQSCKEVCKRNHFSRAEGEAFYYPKLKNKHTYVCKAHFKNGGHAPYKGILYGNNFSATSRKRVCMVSKPNGSSMRALKFHCLCVFK